MAPPEVAYIAGGPALSSPPAGTTRRVYVRDPVLPVAALAAIPAPASGGQRLYRALAGDRQYLSYAGTVGDVWYEIGYDYAAYRWQMHNAAADLALILLLTTAAILVIFPRFFQAGLVQPLTALQAGVRAVNAGRLDVVVPVQMDDEIGFLTQSFNGMVQSLVSAQTQLRDYATDLERSNVALATINQATTRFVPHEFLLLLGVESIVDVQLGSGVQLTMSVLFADIRDFTHLAEGMSPQENFAFIGAYLQRVSPAIRAHGGFIDKYLGDGIMALFPGGADDAVQAAIALQQAVAAYNETRQAAQHQPIGVGIGVHTGRLMLGIVGEPERMDGTVIADAVNTAARLEGLTRRYDVGLIIGEQTRQALVDPAAYALRAIGRVQVKGKQQPIALYEVWTAPPCARAAAKSLARPILGRAWSGMNKATLRRRPTASRRRSRTIPPTVRPGSTPARRPISPSTATRLAGWGWMCWMPSESAPLSAASLAPAPPVRTAAALGALILVLIGLLSVGGYGLFAAIPGGSRAPYLLLFSGLFILYLPACYLVVRAPERLSLRPTLAGIAAVALLARLVLIPATPVFSDDIYRYVWDGRVQAAGISPYAYPPAAPQLAALHPPADPIWPRINRKPAVTIYPAGAELFFAAIYQVAPDQVAALKLALVLVDLASCLVLGRLLGRLGQSPVRVLIYAWAPLPIVEFGGSGHLDALTVLFTLLALLGGVHAVQRGRAAGLRLAVACLAGAALVKLIPLLLLAGWARTFGGRPVGIVLALFAVVSAAFVIGHGGYVSPFVVTYLRDEYVNAPLYYLLAQGLGAGGIPDGVVRLVLLVGLLAFALWVLRQPDAEPYAFLRKRFRLVAAYLLLATSVHPWYATWLLLFVPCLLPGRLALLALGYTGLTVWGGYPF